VQHTDTETHVSGRVRKASEIGGNNGRLPRLHIYSFYHRVDECISHIRRVVRATPSLEATAAELLSIAVSSKKKKSLYLMLGVTYDDLEIHFKSCNELTDHRHT
jgi:hypothetical protein